MEFLALSLQNAFSAFLPLCFFSLSQPAYFPAPRLLNQDLHLSSLCNNADQKSRLLRVWSKGALKCSLLERSYRRKYQPLQKQAEHLLSCLIIGWCSMVGALGQRESDLQRYFSCKTYLVLDDINA